MKRTSYLVLASAAFCLGCVLLNGCSPSDEGYSDAGLYPPRKAAAAEALQELAYTDVATITGTVTYDGDPPPRPEVGGIAQHADRGVCFQGDVLDQTWMVDTATRGVQSVVVSVQPPPKTYFKKPDDKFKAWEDTVLVRQPQCQFIPHVVVLYPEYYVDGRQRAPTGQKLRVINDATIGHNIKVAGSNDINPSSGGQLASRTGEFIFDKIRVDKRELTMNCDVHKWMSGYALTFSHPYAAVTDEKGRFTIKNVPAGVELSLRGWHEGLKHITDPLGNGSKFKLKPGETLVLDFKISKR